MSLSLVVRFLVMNIPTMSSRYEIDFIEILVLSLIPTYAMVESQWHHPS